MLVQFILNSAANTASCAASAGTDSRSQLRDFFLRWMGSGRVSQKPGQIRKRVDKKNLTERHTHFFSHCLSDLRNKLIWDIE